VPYSNPRHREDGGGNALDEEGLDAASKALGGICGQLSDDRCGGFWSVFTLYLEGGRLAHEVAPQEERTRSVSERLSVEAKYLASAM